MLKKRAAERGQQELAQRRVTVVPLSGELAGLVLKKARAGATAFRGRKRVVHELRLRYQARDPSGARLETHRLLSKRP